MANMRVHELAKELNISSKDITDMLSSNEKKYTAMSGLGENEINNVKSRFKAKAVADNSTVKTEPKKAEERNVKVEEKINKTEENKINTETKEKIKPDDAKASAEKKNVAQDGDKKHISQVYFPQNSQKSDNRDRNNNRRDNNGGYRNNDRNRDGNNGYRNNDRNGYGNRDNRDGNNGYRNNDRNGYGNRDNKDGNNGYRNNDRNGNNNGRSGRDGQGFSGARRNDRAASAPKEDFIFETKPDSRRPDSRKNDSRKNDRKKDNEAKENLKFANSKHEKKPVPKPEKKEEETIKQLVLPDTLTIKELADKMKVQPSAIVKKLFLQGKVVTINQEVDYDTAEEIALEFNCICDHEVKVDVIAELLKEDEEDESKMVPRPPVVCVMGHVDHGKTSLLDAIRETHVTDKESGGITQKIGAYMVDVNGQKITFLDTPGHEAFTAMRMRGANATDIAVLVVAADDGIMPQTVESINHAKAAGISVIVAINKMDKEGANPDKIKEELTKYDLVCEEWGGDVICVPVSAKTGEGINTLLEMVCLTADVLELKANPDRLATGAVIEARLDKGRGPIATVLVQNGTLHAGDVLIAGMSVGRVRVMRDDKGRTVKEAGPSVPVEIMGLADVPSAGDTFAAVEDEKLARELVEKRRQEAKEEQFKAYHQVTLDNLFSSIEEGTVKELPIIVKADVQGSVEAVKQSLEKLSNEEVRVRVIHGAVGAVSESDVMLAAASGAIIVGFNVRPHPSAQDNAKRDGIEIRLYRVIYDAIEDITAAMKGMLAPKFREVDLGRVEVRQVYKITNVGIVAGSYVLDGKVTRNGQVRIVRDGIIVGDDKIAGLQRFKDSVKEVAAGYECGISLEKFTDIKVGDIFEAYTMEEYRD